MEVLGTLGVALGLLVVCCACALWPSGGEEEAQPVEQYPVVDFRSQVVCQRPRSMWSGTGPLEDTPRL